MRQLGGRLCQQGLAVFHGFTFTHGAVEGRDKNIDAGLADLCPIAHGPGNSNGQPLWRSLAETLRHTDRGLAIHRLSIDASLPSLSLIHISEPTRLGMISYAVF